MDDARGLELAGTARGGNMQFSNVILAIATLASASALAQPAPPQPPPSRPIAGPEATRDGTIEHVLVSPRGDIDGLLLKDGTVVRFPPHAVVAAAQLRPGSVVHASGAQVTGSDGPTLFDARVTVGGAIVADAALPPPPPRRIEDPEPALLSLTATGRVIRVLANPEGIADAVILEDGTVVHVGPGNALGRAGIAKGAQVTATGLGGKYPSGRSLDAETLKVGAGATLTIDRVPPPRPPTP
jgi:hypothetical protein